MSGDLLPATALSMRAHISGRQHAPDPGRNDPGKFPIVTADIKTNCHFAIKQTPQSAIITDVLEQGLQKRFIFASSPRLEVWDRGPVCMLACEGGACHALKRGHTVCMYCTHTQTHTKHKHTQSTNTHKTQTHTKHTRTNTRTISIRCRV